MKVLLLSALLVTSVAVPSLAQGSYPKAKAKKISREALELEVRPSGRYRAPALEQRQAARVLPVCGSVQRAAHQGAWVVSTPGQSLGEGSVVQIERGGEVLGTGRMIQAGNGVGLMVPDSGVVTQAGDTLRLEYAVQPTVHPVSRANLPSSQDPSYQGWLTRSSSFGGGFNANNYGYGNYGYDDYGYGNYGGFGPGNGWGNYDNSSCNTPCNNAPAPCPPAPEPVYRSMVTF